MRSEEDLGSEGVLRSLVCFFVTDEDVFLDEIEKVLECENLSKDTEKLFRKILASLRGDEWLVWSAMPGCLLVESQKVLRNSERNCGGWIEFEKRLWLKLFSRQIRFLPEYLRIFLELFFLRELVLRGSGFDRFLRFDRPRRLNGSYKIAYGRAVQNVFLRLEKYFGNNAFLLKAAFETSGILLSSSHRKVKRARRDLSCSVDSKCADIRELLEVECDYFDFRYIPREEQKKVELNKPLLLSRIRELEPKYQKAVRLGLSLRNHYSEWCLRRLRHREYVYEMICELRIYSLNLPELSEESGLSEEQFRLHVQIGRCLHASGRGVEALPYLEIVSQEILRKSRESFLAKKVLSGESLIVRAQIAQIHGFHDDERLLVAQALEDYKIINDILEVRSKFWKFSRLFFGGRFYGYWRFFKGVLPKNKSINELGSLMKILGVDVLLCQGSGASQRVEVLSKYMDTLNGEEFWISSGDDRVNVGYLSLGKVIFRGSYLLRDSMIREGLKSVKVDSQDVTFFYKRFRELMVKEWEVVFYEAASKLGLIISKKKADEGNLDESYQILIMALQIMARGIRSTGYRLPPDLFQFFETVGEIHFRHRSFSNEKLLRVSIVCESVFHKCEIVRQSFVDNEDRNGIENLLIQCYQKVAKDLLGRLPDYSENPSKIRILKSVLLMLDRARLRSIDSIFKDEILSALYSESVPEYLRLEFFSVEERLRNLLSEDGRWPTVSGKQIESSSELKRFSDRFRPEGPSIPKGVTKDLEIGRILAAWRLILKEIREYAPSFEYGMLEDTFVTYRRCFSGRTGEPQIHFATVNKGLLVCCFYRKYFSCEFLEYSESRRLKNSLKECLSKKIDIYKELLGFSNICDLVSRFENVVKPSEVNMIRVFLDPTIPPFPVHIFLKKGLQDFLSYSCSVAFSALHSPKTGGFFGEKVFVSCPPSDLDFSFLEGKFAWEGSVNRSLLEETSLSLSEVLTRMNKVSVFHYCGHTYFDGSGVMNAYIGDPDGIKIRLRWMLGNLKLRGRPLVIMNSCRSASTSTIASTVNNTTAVRFSERFESEQVSFAMGFIYCGASSVIGTFWDVDDLVATLFGIKFSRLCQRRGKSATVAKSFRETVKWLRSGLKSRNDVFSFFEDLVSREEVLLDEAEWKNLNVRLSKLPLKFPFQDPVHWGAFVLFE